MRLLRAYVASDRTTIDLPTSAGDFALEEYFHNFDGDGAVRVFAHAIARARVCVCCISV
jgi:hypothetical protein